MSGSSWRKFFEDRGGLILCGFAAALFSIIVLVPAALKHSDISREAAAHSADYSEHSHENVTPECVQPTVQAATKCAIEIHNANRANERAEYDVASQKIMAVWTAVMGSVAVLGVGLSAVGVYLIWTTFKATQRAANISAKTFAAYVSVEGARIVMTAEGSELRGARSAFVPVEIAAHNIGRSVCVLNYVRYTVSTDNSYHSLFEKEGIAHRATIGGDKGMIVIREKIARTSPPIFIKGLLSYTDAASLARTSYFCLRATFTVANPMLDTFGVLNVVADKSTDWPEDT